MFIENSVGSNQRKSPKSTGVGALLRAKNVVDRLSIVIGILAGIILCIMISIVIIDVIGRYSFNKPLPGAMELSMASLVFIAALSLIYTQNQKSHLIVTILTERVSRRWRIVLNVTGLVLGLGIVSMLAWQNIIYAIHSYGISEVSFSTVPIPLYPMKFGLAAGYVLLCIHYVLDILISVRIREEASRLQGEKGEL